MGRESITAAYRKRVWKKAVYFAAAAGGLLVLAAASCCLGIADVTPGRLLATYVPGAR